MATIILAIIGIALSIGGYIASEGIASKGIQNKQQLTEIANKLYSKIQNNNKALDKLMQAWQSRDAALANSVMMQAGFGPAINALRKQQKVDKTEYEEKKGEILDENTKLTNQYNEVVNAQNQAGTSIAANIATDKEMGKYENYARGVDQNVQGGLTDASKV